MIYELTSKDFKINGNDVYITNPNIKSAGMLLIFAEWCDFCRIFHPKFEEISNKLGDGFYCATIEQSFMSEVLAKKLGIQYFPTIKFFDKSKKIKETYPDREPREIPNVLSYVCKFYHTCVV